MSGYRVGIDIGGTFTDFALAETSGETFVLHKQLTTPSDPSVAVLDGLGRMLAENRIGIRDVAHVVHGTTLVTNAVIERRGARTGMLVTAGFADILDIGLEQRYDLYDLRIRFAEPLSERPLRAEVRERLTHEGRVEVPIDPDEAVEATARLVERHGIEALAICFLHAWKNPAHEEAARAAVEAAFPDLMVSTSSDVFPYMREFERWTTTVANAFARPGFDRYLRRIEDGLAALGFRGRFDLMSSSGGIVTPAFARRYPVRMLESGPAAGVIMAGVRGRRNAGDRVLAFDLGGTTAKGALLRGGAPFRTYGMEVARTYRYRRGSGLQLRLPVIDMTEIGSGGGSLAEIDERGLLRVGPRSAGADPGPACYGRGGTRPTLTDANLLLGILDPDYFLGGRMALDVAAAARAIETGVARPLGVDPVRAAWGIHDVVNEDIARAFRIHAAERGFDFRDATMVASGGGGPIHATGVARKLGIPRVIVPRGAGALSAIGLLSAPPSHEVARSIPARLADLTAGRFAAILSEMVGEVLAELAAAGVAARDVALSGALDMRFAGQGYEIECPLAGLEDPAAAFAAVPDGFLAAYRAIFGDVVLDEPLEIIAWTLAGRGPEPIVPGRSAEDAAGGARRPARRRAAYVPERDRFEEVPVVHRTSLGSGDEVIGPALVQEPESTYLLRDGDRARLGTDGDLVVEVATRRRREASEGGARP